MKVVRKYYRGVSCFWLEMECVTLWIMLCTSEYDFVCHSCQSQTFYLNKRRNNGQDIRIIVVEDWTMGKEKKWWENFVLKKKFNFIKKKFWENCTIRKKKYLRKFWTWKPEHVIRILRKFCTRKKQSKSTVRQKKFWEKVV